MPILPRIVNKGMLRHTAGRCLHRPLRFKKAFFYSSSSFQFSARFCSVAVFSWER